MNTDFSENGWEDFEYWLENDPEIVDKIRDLIKAIKKEPFRGIGKPEPLKFALKGFWSRRITGEHRLINQISGSKGKDQKCTIIQCRCHYDD